MPLTGLIIGLYKVFIMPRVCSMLICNTVFHEQMAALWLMNKPLTAKCHHVNMNIELGDNCALVDTTLLRKTKLCIPPPAPISFSYSKLTSIKRYGSTS